MPRTSRKAAAAAKGRARLDVDERRAQLIALGMKLFADRSYEEVSIDELARAAGISKGLLYHYFPTKHDYYVAALTHAARQLLEETQTPGDMPAADRLERGLDAYLSFVERHGPAYVALIRGGIGSDSEVAAILDRTRGTFAERVLEGLPGQPDTPLLRMALRGWVGFVEAISVEWVARRSGARSEITALLVAVLASTVQSVVGNEPQA